VRLTELIADEYEYGGINAARSNRNYFYYSNALANKAVFLSKRGLDTFFDLYEGQSVRLDVDDMAEVTPLVLANPEIRFQLNVNSDNQCLSLSADTSKLVGLLGEKHSYILHRDCFYRTTQAFYKTLEPMIKAFSGASQNTILISKEDVPRFMTFLYPRLKEQRLLDSDSVMLNDLYAEYCPLVKKLYFDVSDKGEVLLRVSFCYGEKEFNPLKDTADKKTRNMLEEYKLLQRLMVFGFVEGEDREHYVLKDDEMIYDFYYAPGGLNALREENETYATDEFMNKSLKSKASTSFGIRLKGNLLEVKFDAKDYNIKELNDIINAYQLRKKYHRLKNGVFISLEDETGGLDATLKLISGLGISEKELRKGVVNVPKYRALYLENIIRNNQSMDAAVDSAVESVASDFRAFKALRFDIPETLAPVLRPYQKDGFNWLRVIAHYQFGGILADDMGLGKTLEVISVLLAAKGTDVAPSIVVAPTSLIYNWEKEIQRFAPELKTLAIAGTSAKRKETLLNAGDADVYITTYDMLKRDIDLYEDRRFEYIIADEAQNIKNPATQNAKAVKTLKGNVRFALTGTPIENSLMELWSIFDFIMPGYLYTNSKFVKHYESPIIKNNDERKSEELSGQIAPFILRRLKKDVLQDLPEKIETTLYADMTEEQHKIYTAYLMKAKGVLEEHVKNAAFSKNKIDILAQLTRLRQICCHPAVFIDGYQGGSGKLALTLETVHSSIESGHRLLIFSQFTSMLQIIAERLKIGGIPYFYLDGATDSKQRLLMADRFNGGERSVFLISLKAGGTGLNLTGADVVIHFDPWWNPAVMDQASDRAHRFGQKKTVQVINIVAKDSIEEKIMQLQAKKKDLVDAVIKEGASFINQMSEEEIVKLFEA
jgi:SNF2 family DNA or RNA helicase